MYATKRALISLPMELAAFESSDSGSPHEADNGISFKASLVAPD